MVNWEDKHWITECKSEQTTEISNEIKKQDIKKKNEKHKKKVYEKALMGDIFTVAS